MKRYTGFLLSVLLLALGTLQAADRETQVRNDLTEVQAAGLWIYNDLEKGFAEAQRTGKPLMIVFR